MFHVYQETLLKGGSPILIVDLAWAGEFRAEAAGVTIDVRGQKQAAPQHAPGELPTLSEYGTYETVKARFWPWLSGEIFQVVPSSLNVRGQEQAAAEHAPGAPPTLIPQTRNAGSRDQSSRFWVSSFVFWVSVEPVPLPSEYGTYKTVKARFGPWLSGKSSKLFPLRSMYAAKNKPRLSMLQASLPP